MKWEMEILSRAAYPNRVIEGRKCTWTPVENKMFENALAVHDKDTPDRWQKVAEMIPGKTAGDVMKQYKELETDVSNIEAGLVPIPGYSTSPFTLNWASSHGYCDGFTPSCGIGGKRGSSVRPADQERKKGVPWTEEEHKLFLMGLKKYGKGDWRNISRNFVVTRTPTQVASHAQKYFIRQLSGGKDKRRASIHDITTVNLINTKTHSHNDEGPPSPEQSAGYPQHSNSTSMPKTPHHWSQSNCGANMGFNPTNENIFMSNPCGINSYGMKMQGQNQHRGSIHESHNGPQCLGFQIQSAHHYPY